LFCTAMKLGVPATQAKAPTKSVVVCVVVAEVVVVGEVVSVVVVVIEVVREVVRVVVGDDVRVEVRLVDGVVLWLVVRVVVAVVVPVLVRLVDLLDVGLVDRDVVRVVVSPLAVPAHIPNNMHHASTARRTTRRAARAMATCGQEPLKWFNASRAQPRRMKGNHRQWPALVPVPKASASAKRWSPNVGCTRRQLPACMEASCSTSPGPAAAPSCPHFHSRTVTLGACPRGCVPTSRTRACMCVCEYVCAIN